MAMFPFNVGVDITKSDTVNIDIPPSRDGTDAIYVGGAGVVAVVFPNNQVANFTCVAGQILPVEAKRVNSTNTTATLMVALWKL